MMFRENKTPELTGGETENSKQELVKETRQETMPSADALAEADRMVSQRISGDKTSGTGGGISFEGGLGATQIKHLRGSQLLSEASRLESEARSKLSAAQRADMSGLSGKAASLRSQANSLKNQARTKRREGEKLVNFKP